MYTPSYLLYTLPPLELYIEKREPCQHAQTKQKEIMRLCKLLCWCVARCLLPLCCGHTVSRRAYCARLCFFFFRSARPGLPFYHLKEHDAAHRGLLRFFFCIYFYRLIIKRNSQKNCVVLHS